MRFEGFTHPKARDLSVPGDDVLLHVPGRVTAIFDGATDSHGRRRDGVPLGRLAALAAARALVALPQEVADWDAAEVMAHLSGAVARAAPHDGVGRPASTTALIVFEGDTALRVVGLGDTGYRVNGGAVRITDLAPDAVTIPARVTLFRHFQAAGLPARACETRARQVMSEGLDPALGARLIDRALYARVMEQAVTAHPGAAEAVAEFLRGGLQSQHHFANRADHPLGYGVLDGTAPAPEFIIDESLPREDLASLEVFSDGYMVPPEGLTVADWEAAHAAVEARDPHKIDATPAVKGSTAEAFFDDRTVAILRCKATLPPD